MQARKEREGATLSRRLYVFDGFEALKQRYVKESHEWGRTERQN